MHGGTEALLAWPGRSGAVERAQRIVRASLPCNEPNVLESRRNKAETSRIRRGGALRRGRGNSPRFLTSVERAQGLTAVKTSAAVVLAQRLGHWRGRRRAAELGQQWRCSGAAAAAALANEGGEGAGRGQNGGAWGRGVASRPG